MSHNTSAKKEGPPKAEAGETSIRAGRPTSSRMGWRARLADYAYTRPWIRWAVHRCFEVVRVSCDCGYTSAPMMPSKAERWLANPSLHGLPEYGHANLRIVSRQTRYTPRWDGDPGRWFS